MGKRLVPIGNMGAGKLISSNVTEAGSESFMGEMSKKSGRGRYIMCYRESPKARGGHAVDIFGPLLTDPECRSSTLKDESPDRPREP